MSPVGYSSALNHEGLEPGAGISRNRRLAFDLRRCVVEHRLAEATKKMKAAQTRFDGA